MYFLGGITICWVWGLIILQGGGEQKMGGKEKKRGCKVDNCQYSHTKNVGVKRLLN